MRNCLVLFLVLNLFCGCQWSAEDEQKLITVVNRYLFAENNKLMLSKAALTHPLFLKEILKKGDSSFINHFNVRSEWNDPVIRNKIQENDNWQVEFKIRELSSDTLSKKIKLYLVSEDAGKNWFVLEQKFYQNLTLVPQFKRLLKYEN